MSKNVSMIKTSEQFIKWLKEHEYDLMERIMVYAKQYDYTKYTSMLIEAWRVSIVGLTDSLELLMKASPEVPSMGPDESFSEDPASQFGLIEAKRHRSRGVNYAMFISLFKYYRQTYHDLIEENRHLFDDHTFYYKYVQAFFDRVEIAYSIEWHGRSAEDQIHELSKQNREVTNEKNLYLTIFDSLGMAIILVDSTGGLLNYNPAASELLFGYRQQSGAFYYGLDKKVETPSWLTQILTEGKKQFQYESIIDGEKKVYSGLLVPTNDVSGRLIGYIITFTDITDVVELNKNLYILKAAIENAPISFVITDTYGNIEYANPWFTNVTGYTLSETIGQNPRILRSGFTSDDEYQQLWNEITTHHIWKGVFKNLRKDGSSYWESATIVPVVNKDNLLTNFLGIKQEISEEVRLKEVLSVKDTQIEELASIVQFANVEIYIFNKTDMNFIYANELALQNTGYDFDSLKRMTPYHLKNISKDELMIQCSRLETSNNTNFEARHYRNDGTSYPVNVILQRSHFNNEEVYVAIVTDMSKFYEMQQEVQSAHNLMITQSRNAAMGEMISMIAHHWRQPLSIISMVINNATADMR